MEDKVIELAAHSYAVPRRKSRRAPKRKQFADGSAIITYPDATRAILENSLAKPAALHQENPVNYRKGHGRRSNRPYERG